MTEGEQARIALLPKESSGAQLTAAEDKKDSDEIKHLKEQVSKKGK